LSVAARALHVIPAVAARYGGPSVAAFEMCRALAAERIDTMLVTTDADGQGRLPVPIGEVTETSGVPTIYFRRRGSESYKWAQGLANWVTAHIREFDLVHVHAVFSYASMTAARIALAAGVPFIVRPLGTLDPWSLARHRWRKRALLELGLQRALAGASAIHYTSLGEQQLAEAAQPWLPRGVVVPLGIEEAFFADGAGENSEHPYVLALGRLDGKKGLNVLIRAFHDAWHRGHSEWRLVIAGDGDPRTVRALKALAASGPAASRIVFPGWVDGARRETWVRRASLFALPSAQENFGLALGEAMASGVPVLVTPGVNLAPDIASAGAGWVVERAQPALAAGLGQALQDRAERLRRGAAARRFAERFRWSAIARALTALYVDVLRGAELRRGAPAGAR
jgi:glycosyltransferase involved in cell wall biosynthesis